MNRRIRVLQVITHLGLGGAERSTCELVGGLAERVEFGLLPIFATESGDSFHDQLLSHPGIQIFPALGSRSLCRLPIIAQRLVGVIRRFQPEIIHLNTEIPEFVHSLASLYSRDLRSIKVVRTIRNTDLWGRRTVLPWVVERILKNGKLVFISQSVRSSFTEYRNSLGLRLSTEGEVIYNPITVPALNETREAWHPTQNRPFKLLFGGRFEHQKGVDLFPEILGLVSLPEGVRVDLDVFGSGALERVFQELGEHLGLNWTVRMRPPIPNFVEEMRGYDALLFPSRHEGYGRTAAEACLMKIPVLGFRIPPFTEIFSNSYPYLTKDGRICVNSLSLIIENLIKTGSNKSVTDIAKARLENKISPTVSLNKYLCVYEKIAIKNKTG